jgi:ATP-dependent Clp protease ATP-binding subunit ClpA
MDYATLTDNNGRKADFRHVILLMTSNAGAREMSKGNIGFKRDEDDDRKDGALKAIEKLFSPEFRNRLDAIVPFGSLSSEVMEMIVDKFINELNEQLAERRVSVELTAAARSRLAEMGHDPAFGARPMGRVIQTEIKDAIADELLFGSLMRGGVAVADVAGTEDVPGEIPAVGPSGEFVFTFKRRSKGKTG